MGVCEEASVLFFMRVKLESSNGLQFGQHLTINAHPGLWLKFDTALARRDDLHLDEGA